MNKKKRVKEKNSAVEEDVSKINTDDTSTAQTFEEYQCLGNVEIDFPRLCALMNISDIPAVLTKQTTSSTLEPDGGNPDEEQLQKNTTGFCSKPALQVELETDDSFSAKSIKILGWPVDEQIVKVLNKMFPSLSNLHKLHFWQARLTDKMIISLKDTVSLSSNLRRVTLEGNPVPEHSYHHLLSDDNPLTHLSLRNNRIGDEGARLIGSALSTPRSANENLLSLNLAFNSIGDKGAAHIAKGLRLNRALLSLSLSNNRIGDPGAARLAEVLGPFALTHEEVVARRKLLLEREQSLRIEVDGDPLSSTQSSTSQSAMKGTSKKQDRPKPGAPPNEQPAETVETRNPMLDEAVQYRDYQFVLPGNTALLSLRLLGNRITADSLPLFLKSLQTQPGERGLQCLSLQRNHFPPDCEIYVKIKELMTLRDPLNKNTSGQLK